MFSHPRFSRQSIRRRGWFVAAASALVAVIAISTSFIQTGWQPSSLAMEWAAVIAGGVIVYGLARQGLAYCHQTLVNLVCEASSVAPAPVRSERVRLKRSPSRETRNSELAMLQIAMGHRVI